MSQPFVGEIRMFTGNFPPKGWAFCNGQLLSISQNTALFSLLGTYYGGDGKSTFALPNLQDSLPMHQGQGPGLSLRDLGEVGGESAVTLLTTELPSHNHSLSATDAAATTANPLGAYMGKATSGRSVVDGYAPSGAGQVAMGSQSVDYTGGNQAHNNMPPVLALSFIIALQGVYPARN